MGLCASKAAATMVHLVEHHAAARKAGAGLLLGAPVRLSPDTNSPVDCLCLAKGRASVPGAACKARGAQRAEGVVQRGHETEHRSAVGVPTDRLTEAPGGSPAAALLAQTLAQRISDSELQQRAASRHSFLCD